MPTILIEHREKIIQEDLPLEKDLLWYDTELKTMKKFKGGVLEFKYEYDPDLKKNRLLPYPKEIFTKVTKKIQDVDYTNKMLNIYIDRYSISCSVVEKNNRGIIVDVSDDEVQYFKNFMDDSGINYE